MTTVIIYFYLLDYFSSDKQTWTTHNWFMEYDEELHDYNSEVCLCHSLQDYIHNYN